jgi:hypothetical protein
VFLQNVIAVIWDFDKTLIPGYMQVPIFERYDVDGPTFWKEVNALPAFYKEHGHPLFPNDIGYLSHVLTYIREGIFDGLSNSGLRELGQKIEFFPGLPDFFGEMKRNIEDNPEYRKCDITLEHYVVSTGLRQMILGSAIAPHVEDVWACELLGINAPPGLQSDTAATPAEDAPLISIAYAIDNTTKTRAIFEINKGVNRHPEIDVNAKMEPEARRVPFENMIYIADGPSDVPVFSVLNQNGGKTYAVYPPDGPEKEVDTAFRQVRVLREQGRVMEFGEADYRPGTHTNRCITTWADSIAKRITDGWQARLRSTVGAVPKHIVPTATDPE